MTVQKENYMIQETQLEVPIDLITLGEAINFSKFCPPTLGCSNTYIYAIKDCARVKRGRECRHSVNSEVVQK